ncbi:MAG: invasin domain 3-containing protein [Patescibacteria group bacterium]
MRRDFFLLAAAFVVVGLTAVVPQHAHAGNRQIRVSVRNEFSTNISGTTVIYSCGSGEYSVTDDDGFDQDATDGVILITPAVAASCDIADDLVVRVQNLSAAGYLDWIDETTFYDTNRENSYIATMRFSVLVRLTDQFGVTPLTAPDASGIFAGGATVNGVLSPDHTQLGFPVPVGGSDGTLTVIGLGSLGYLNTVTSNISVPPTGDSPQRAYNSRNQYSILVLGRDQFGLELLGSGGSALFQSSTQIACPNQGGTNFYGCPVPVGNAASTVRVTRPGYVDFTAGSAAPPASATGVQTALQTANLFAVKVLGVANEFGSAITPTSTPAVIPVFLASGTNILGMRLSGNEWYIAATPGSAQLTVQVQGYANTAVRIEISAAGQATADYDTSTGSTWAATVDGPALPADMYVTLYDTTGAAVSGANVTIYTNNTYSGTKLATDLRLSGSNNASRQTESDGSATFALPSGSYWVQIVKGGVVSWGSAADPKPMGFVESGAPWRYTLNLQTGTGALAPRAVGQAAVSATRSTIVAVPGAVAADGTSAITVTVTARDDAGNILSGRGVNVASNRPADVWNTTVGTTDENGAAVFTLRSTLVGSSTLTAVVDGVALSGSANVSFTSGSGGSGLLYPAGTLLKISCPANSGPFHHCRAVYFYGSDGKRHAFPNDKIYRTWYADFSSIQTINEALMGTISLGANVRYRPGARLVKLASVQDVYAVERGGGLLPLASESIAATLYGSAWASAVDDINEAFFFDYTVGQPITNPATYSPSATRDGTTTIDQEQGR